MEDAASILLGFPPANPPSSDKEYDRAICMHKYKVKDLLEKTQSVKDSKAVKLLDLLDPAVNSLSYIAVLDALHDYDGISAEHRAVVTIQFFTSFDVRQIRYVGDMFLDYLTHVVSEKFILPYDVKVGLLAQAILRLDPTGSMLTTAHLDLVHLAYDSDTAECAFSVLDRQIVYFPGMDSGNSSSSNTNEKYLCDLSLLPPDYISEDTGLTGRLDVETVLEYDFLAGLLYLSRRQWKKAHAAFERIISHPTRDGGVSKIMSEAYNKWLLVSLLLNGHTPRVPANAGSNAKKTYDITGKPYHALAAHFDVMSAVDLKKEVDTHVQMWHDDRNSGLVQEVLAAHQKWQIMNLRNAFSKIAISQIRETTSSAETGNALPSEVDVERLVQGMIDSRMLNGVIVKPGENPAYLEYLAEVQELSEVEYKKEVAAAMKRLKELEAVYRTTNARLSTNPNWIKHVVREKKREKDNTGPGAVLEGFESHVDEEDLMTDIVPGGL